MSMLVLARRSAYFACLFFFTASALFAQKYTPKQITFSGYADASQSELLTASGLKPGVPIDQPEMETAAKKLSGTGLFSDIRFSYNGIELHYQLSPAGGFVPVSYANFPWWTSQELNAAVAARVPLFKGKVIPDSGLQQEISSALTSLIEQKGVSAHVVATPFSILSADSSGQPAGVSFRIESPPVQIGSVSLAGATSDWTTQLEAIEKAAAGQDYGSETQAALVAAVNAVYHRQGYLDVELSHFTYGVPQFTGGKVIVPASATIVQGAQYRLAGLHFPGGGLLSSADFAKCARIHVGDIADEDLLRQTLAALTAPYKAKGHLNVEISEHPIFDDAQHTVDYTITLMPGPVFYMGKLAIQNLNPEQEALVLKYWTMHKGDVFDATYPPLFLNRNKNNMHGLDAWSATYKQYANLDTHIVDLVITFHHGGPLN